MSVPIVRMNSLWWESGNIAVREEEDSLVISEPLSTFPPDHLFLKSGPGLKRVMKVSRLPETLRVNRSMTFNETYLNED